MTEIFISSFISFGFSSEILHFINLFSYLEMILLITVNENYFILHHLTCFSQGNLVLEHKCLAEPYCPGCAVPLP